MAPPIWVVDTSAVIEIGSFIRRDQRPRVFDAFTALVDDGRLKFPLQVLRELKRDVEGHSPDQACAWALTVETAACDVVTPYEEVKAVLAVVPDILDTMKDPEWTRLTRTSWRSRSDFVAEGTTPASSSRKRRTLRRSCR
jgi:hypothetical protein